MAVNLTPAEAADEIDRFLRGAGNPYDWDDFTSIRCNDPVVEAARLRCIAVRDEHPPELPGEYCNARGREVLRKLSAKLRERDRPG